MKKEQCPVIFFSLNLSHLLSLFIYFTHRMNSNYTIDDCWPFLLLLLLHYYHQQEQEKEKKRKMQRNNCFRTYVSIVCLYRSCQDRKWPKGGLWNRSFFFCCNYSQIFLLAFPFLTYFRQRINALIESTVTFLHGDKWKKKSSRLSSLLFI